MNSAMKKVGISRSSKQILVKTGQRLTNQRALLLDLIRQGQGHMDADELYRIARLKRPRLSLSTVYRSLQLFKKLGLVEERHFDDTHHHYEVKGSRDHIHLFCLNCGQVTEYFEPIDTSLKEQISKEKDFEIAGIETRISGYCSKCKGKKKDT